VAWPPPGSNPSGARLPPALPRFLAGANGKAMDLLRRQSLLAPRLRCLWSPPAGLLPRGLASWNKKIEPNSGVRNNVSV
jgi:hypothetical protein